MSNDNGNVYRGDAVLGNDSAHALTKSREQMMAEILRNGAIRIILPIFFITMIYLHAINYDQ